MGRAKTEPVAVRRDWVQEEEDSRVVDSVETQSVARQLGSRSFVTAPELAIVLNMSTNAVYSLVDSGEIGYIDVGSGTKRRCIFPRASVIAFAKKRSNSIR